MVCYIYCHFYFINILLFLFIRTSKHDWKGLIPHNEMPYCVNPTNGFIVSCNHKVVSDDYPYHLSNHYASGYRAQRVQQMIEKKIKESSKIDISYFEEMHADVVDLSGFCLNFVNVVNVMHCSKRFDRNIIKI